MFLWGRGHLCPPTLASRPPPPPRPQERRDRRALVCLFIVGGSEQLVQAAPRGLVPGGRRPAASWPQPLLGPPTGRRGDVGGGVTPSCREAEVLEWTRGPYDPGILKDGPRQRPWGCGHPSWGDRAPHPPQAQCPPPTPAPRSPPGAHTRPGILGHRLCVWPGHRRHTGSSRPFRGWARGSRFQSPRETQTAALPTGGGG